MKITLKIVAMAAILGLAGTSFAQSSAQGTGGVGFTLAKGICLNLYNQTDGYLDFGTLIPSNSANPGTAVVSPWATAYGLDAYYGNSTLTNLVQLNPTSDPVKTSRWVASGQPNALFTLDLPGGAATLVAGATVDTWKWYQLQGEGSQFDGQTVVCTFPASGNMTFSIGGTLHIPANYGATPQEMSTTFLVNVHY